MNNFIEKLKVNIPDIIYIYSYNSAVSLLNFIKNERIRNLVDGYKFNVYE